MPRIDNLEVEFVETMPEVLDNGVLYVSEECRVALHNCCCGCGEEVSTPLGPTEYRLKLVDGKATLKPSIGNHDYACRSHYVIEDGLIEWAGAMSREDIEAGRELDRLLKRGPKPRGSRAVLSWLRNLYKKVRQALLQE